MADKEIKVHSRVIRMIFPHDISHDSKGDKITGQCRERCLFTTMQFDAKIKRVFLFCFKFKLISLCYYGKVSKKLENIFMQIYRNYKF